MLTLRSKDSFHHIFNSKIEVPSLQYPSVSVCIEHTYKKYIDDELSGNTGNYTMQGVEQLAKSLMWKRNDTFYFVNQKTSQNDGFPCMTTSESTDPGRPCMFPFKYYS